MYSFIAHSYTRNAMNIHQNSVQRMTMNTSSIECTYIDFHVVKLKRNRNLTISVDFEIHPLSKTLDYCRIYGFDDATQIYVSYHPSVVNSGIRQLN
jgi:hypothetical protein